MTVAWRPFEVSLFLSTPAPRLAARASEAVQPRLLLVWYRPDVSCQVRHPTRALFPLGSGLSLVLTLFSLSFLLPSR